MRNVLKMLGLVLVASVVGCNVDSTGVEGDAAEMDESIGEAESALPSEEREIEFYADASMEDLVGMRVQTCEGVFLWGHTSPYWIASRVQSCQPPFALSSPWVGCYDMMGYCSAAYQSCMPCW